MTGTVQEFRVRVPEESLADLRRRLRDTRWPEPATTPGWTQGVPLDHLQDLCAYWADGYDWRRLEEEWAALEQYRVAVDGLGVHVLRATSPHPGALPLVLTHGWPGSVVEFLDLVGPLTDPPAHGGRAEDAFTVVLPSLPGYGFSDKPRETGWGIRRIAAAWDEIMRALGHERYLAAGSDWGTSVSTCLAQAAPDRVAGIHLIPPLAGPGDFSPEEFTAAERRATADLEQRGRDGSAYSAVHATVPQTIGYSLVDSPAGLCAWLVEKFWTWADHDGDLYEVISRDRLLDDVTLYWLTRSGASSARLYRESIAEVSSWFTRGTTETVDVPAGCSIFPSEVPRPSRRWAEQRFPDIRYWAEHGRGGHFAALEQPALLVGDLRAFARLVR
ncbi:UNVERIFIED_ORG: epoxide hydrolase [Bacillus sp. AZ43]